MMSDVMGGKSRLYDSVRIIAEYGNDNKPTE